VQVTAADDDYTHNNIAHEFLSTKSQLLDSVFRVFTLLLPDSLFTFSAAKYCRQGHIKPHDDRAYTQVILAAAKCADTLDGTLATRTEPLPASPDPSMGHGASPTWALSATTQFLATNPVGTPT
jgi:hypothetical protein